MSDVATKKNIVQARAIKIEDIVESYRRTKSVNGTARELGVSGSMIRNRLKSAGEMIEPEYDTCGGQEKTPYGPEEHAAWMAEHVRMHDFEPLGGSSLAQEPSRL